jgi:predicted acyltransferase
MSRRKSHSRVRWMGIVGIIQLNQIYTFASGKRLTRRSGVIICTTVMLPEALSMCDSIGSPCFPGATAGLGSESNQVAYGDNNRKTHV